MENLAQKLKEFRINKGFSQKVIADKLNIPQTTWSGYERGRSNPTVGILVELKKLGFDYNSAFSDITAQDNISSNSAKDKINQARNLPDDMELTRAGRVLNGNDPELKDSFVIPVLDQNLSAGVGCDLPDIDKPVAYISAPKSLSKFGTNLAALYVDGDSMEPTLNRGDMIVCDSCGWTGEGIYAIQMDGCGFVKRIARKPGKAVIISDNPIYAPFEISLEDESVRIIGRVHCVLHNVD